jgi:hypothetical protein
MKTRQISSWPSNDGLYYTIKYRQTKITNHSCLWSIRPSVQHYSNKSTFLTRDLPRHRQQQQASPNAREYYTVPACLGCDLTTVTGNIKFRTEAKTGQGAGSGRAGDRGQGTGTILVYCTLDREEDWPHIFIIC